MTILQSAPSAKLMQSYREEQPATALGALVPLVDAAGLIHLITLGTGNTVYEFHEDPTSDTGWAGPVATGLTGPLVSAVFWSGTLMVFASDGGSLTYASSSDGGLTFQGPNPLYSPGQTISAIRAQTTTTPLPTRPFMQPATLFVMATCQCTPDPGGPVQTVILSLSLLPVVGGVLVTDNWPLTDQDGPTIQIINSTTATPAIAGVITPQLYRQASGTPHRVWSSAGAINEYDYGASFWRTQLPGAPYFALGDLCVQGSDAAPTSGAVMVRQVFDPSGALAPPLLPATPLMQWQQIWNDRDSDADDNVTVWRAGAVNYQTPAFSANYVVLGDVVIGNYDDDQPTNAYAFVNTNLLTPGVVASPIPDCSSSTGELCNQNLLYLIDNSEGTVPAAFDAVTGGSAGVTGGVFYTHSNDGLGMPSATVSTLAAAPTLPSSVIAWNTVADYGGGTAGSLGAPSARAVTASAWADDASGLSQLFAVLADGFLYAFVAGSWILLDGVNHYLAVTATRGPAGLEVFGLGSGRQVFHVRQTAGGWSEPLRLTAGPSVGAIAAVTDSTGTAVCFAAVAGDEVVRVAQDPTTGDWSIEPVELPATGKIVELYAWSVEITARDDDGNLLPDAVVSVYADGVVEATLNGAGQILDPGLAVQATTNAAARFTIASVANSLTSPTFYFQTTAMTAAATAVQIQPNAAMQGTLASATPADYVAQLGLSEVEAEALASAIQKIMAFDSAEEATPTLVRPPVGRPRRVPGVRVVRCGEEAAARRITIREPARVDWEIDFSGPVPVFRTFTLAEAAARARARARRPRANGLLSWLSDLGDLIAGLFDGAVQLVSYAAQWVGDQMQAAYTFIVNGIEYVYDTFVDTLTDAFNAAVAFFVQLGASFDKLVSWLGFLFDWQDMLRSADAINYVLSSVLGGFLTGGLPQLQTLMDGWVGEASSYVASAFTALQDAVGSTGSLDTAAETAAPDTPPALDAIAGTNVVLDGAINNPDGTAIDLSRARQRVRLAWAVADDDPTQVTFAQFETSFAATSSYQTASGDLSTATASDSSDTVLASPLATLLSALQGVVTQALGSGQVLVDAMFASAITAAATLFGTDGLLNATLDIPFVSALYTYLTGNAELTVGGLIALILAIPFTIIYKIGAGESPFGDDAAVADFKATITAEGLLAATGLAAPDAAPALRPMVIDAKLAMVFGTLNSVAYFVTGVAAGLADAIPLTGVPGSDALVSMWSAMLCNLEWLGFVSSCTYLQGQPFEFSCTEGGIGNIAWAISIGGPLVDSLTYGFSTSSTGFGKIMRNLNNGSILLDLVFSVFSLAATCWAGGSTGSVLECLEGVFLYFPAFLRLARIDSTPTSLTLLQVVGTLDFVSNVIAAVLQLVATFSTAAAPTAPTAHGLPLALPAPA